jgi:heme/copper-type cytochrome/quinol oxidase subunit 2
MPIKVVAVSKDAFQRWVADAKKKFAQRDDTAAAVRVAAIPGLPDSDRPATAGN